MLIKKIEIKNNRSIRNAICESVPRVMVIAGPNGAGKSTLLHYLKTQYAGQAIYVGPHRHTRRQTVNYRSLLSREISLEQVLKQPQVGGGIEGLNIMDSNRDAWSSDEALNYLKHGLCQIEIERKEVISAIFDRDNKIAEGSIPDLWLPLRELTHNLLPHLSFEKIEITNRDNIRCLWKVHSKDTIVDLDELSSGEKAIIHIFYPLIEHKIKAILRSLKDGKAAVASQAICVLIDEPELHLHPNLQYKVLDYFRILAADEKAQIICTTQSPTFVEHSTFDELFLLRPYELLKEGDNQLIQIASDEERLNYLRTTFGSTSNLTAMQPVIIVEGIPEHKSSKSMSDRKLYRALHHKFDKVTVIPGGGKSECLKLLDILEPALKSFSPNLKVVALLDSDVGGASKDDRVFVLPVSMIENFLIDPTCIWESIQAVIEKTGISNPKELEAKIDELLSESEEKEVIRRVVHGLGADVFRVKAPLDQIPSQTQSFITEIQEKYKKENLEHMHKVSSELVKQIKADSKRRELFKGKDILEAFHAKYLHATGFSKAIFKFETARQARLRKSVTNFFDDFFQKIEKQ